MSYLDDFITKPAKKSEIEIVVIEAHQLPSLGPLTFESRGEENHYFLSEDGKTSYCLKTNH